MKYSYIVVFITVLVVTFIVTAIVVNTIRPEDNIAPKRTTTENEPINPEINKVITGKIVKNPASKATDSYCAQTQDFYMVDADLETIVLEASSAISKAKFEQLNGQEVKLKGSLHEVTINCEAGLECPDSPNGIFKCDRLKVLEIFPAY